MTPQARPAAAGARWRLLRKVVVVVIGVPVLALGMVLIVLRRCCGRLGITARRRPPDTGVGTPHRGADVERKQASHARHKEEAS